MDIARSVEFIKGLDVSTNQKKSLSHIEYLSRDGISLKDYKNEVFLEK